MFVKIVDKGEITVVHCASVQYSPQPISEDKTGTKGTLFMDMNGDKTVWKELPVEWTISDPWIYFMNDDGKTIDVFSPGHFGKN